MVIRWKKLVYSTGMKGLSVIALSIFVFLGLISSVGIKALPSETSYMAQQELGESFAYKAGLVRKWLVQYADETYLERESVSKEDIRDYQTATRIIQSDRKTIDNIILQRREAYQMIKDQLIRENKNILFLARNNQTRQVITNVDLRGQLLEAPVHEEEMDSSQQEQIIEQIKSKEVSLTGDGDSILRVRGVDAQLLGQYYVGEGLSETARYEIYVALKTNLIPGDSFYDLVYLFNEKLRVKPYLYGMGILSIIGVILMMIYWYLAHMGDQQSKMSHQLSQIPFEFHLLIGGLIVAFSVKVMNYYLSNLTMEDWFPYGVSDLNQISLWLIVPWLLLVISIGISFYSSLMTHLKYKSLKSWSLSIRVIKKLIGLTRKDGVFALVTFLVVGGYSLINLLLMRWHNQTFLIGFVVCNILFVLIGTKFVMDYIKLSKIAQAIGEGKLDVKANLKYTLPHLKAFEENLVHIQDGLEKAVATAVKSEHFRTELITNVSHDLKTPLTSMISYIDLLKQEPIENEQAKSYIEILKERSGRLKQLIEDLVEASKAITGNIQTELVSLQLDQLVLQAVGEYTDRLEASKLQVITECIEAVEVVADGRHMCRVVENLLSNVSKYAMPHTRVYIEVKKELDRARLIIKNISWEYIKVSPEELTERFVRGDESRSTEGSGLGLAIAQSLVKAQGGELAIYVDGDLFKVEVSL